MILKKWTAMLSMNKYNIRHIEFKYKIRLEKRNLIKDYISKIKGLHIKNSLKLVNNSIEIVDNSVPMKDFDNLLIN